jgi:lysophospholipase L1-like esterase
VGVRLPLAALLSTLCCLLPSTAGAAEPLSYVALGDSYTSGVGIPPQSGVADCGQSGVDYPHLTAEAEGLALTDVSCAGASTANMTVAQYLDQPPQLDALTPTTDLVTISIGGNDNNFYASTIQYCTWQDMEDAANIGAPCKKHYGHTLANQILADGAAIGQAIAQIHVRSPNAKVFVIGYPDLLPRQGSCWASLPWTSGDYHFFDGLERDFNSVFKTQAQVHGATFVDTYKASVGHDICQPVGTRWMEPLYGASGAALHPNASGERHQALAVELAMTKAGIH